MKNTVLSAFLFDCLKEGAEGELSAAAAAISCTPTALFTHQSFLICPPAGLLLSFCVLNFRKQKEKSLGQGSTG